MIALSTLPKNSRGIIKNIDTQKYTKQDLDNMGIIIGTKVKVKRIEQTQILVETYFIDRKERIYIPIEEALRISVMPI